MSEKPVYFLITKEELTHIKNNCAYPKRIGCNGCDFGNHISGCRWSPDVLVDEVMTRTLESELRKMCDECSRPDEIDCDICAKQNFDGG